MNFTYYFISICFILLISQMNNVLEKYSQDLPNTKLSIDMVPIPEGIFTMGKKNDISLNFSQNEVKISPFWISKYEITWDIYQLFMEQVTFMQDSIFKRGDEVIEIDGISGPTTPYIDMSFGMGTEGFPAVNMTHYAASKFCEWLSSLTGNYYRLPTEAEWEYACRAGTSSDYSFDNSIDSLVRYAWFKKNSNKKYQKVGQKNPNDWGVYDMHGNVSEWTADSYFADIYKKRKKSVNPFEFNENKYPKVYRGGSWLDDSIKLTSYDRKYSTSSLQKRDPQIPKSKWWNTDAPFIGFRIVRPLNTDSDDKKFIFWNY